MTEKEVVVRRYQVTLETRESYCRALVPLVEVPRIPELEPGDVYVLAITETPLLLDLFESVLAECLKRNSEEI